MKVGICTIQRDRAQWIPEWIAFHHAAGFKKFYIYLHNCVDNSEEVVIKLKRIYDIECHIVPKETERPQLVAYQHAYSMYGDEVDWIAFIDGDEFLFSPKYYDISEAISIYDYKKISALGVWWQCYSSNNHIFEPDGLIIENYTKRPQKKFELNKHFKSIVRGRQGNNFSVLLNSHFFKTLHGTYDEKERALTHGRMPEIDISTEIFRINHYVAQSYEFFKKFKQFSGAADAGKNMIRTEEDWRVYADDNSEHDTDAHKYLPQIRRELDLYNLL
jgi:hypothetical protein